jgi:hypothetical protein
MLRNLPIFFVSTLTLLACSKQVEDTDPVDTGTPIFETERMLLHEMFTGSTCGPCEPAEAYIEGVMDARPGQYTSIKYQLGGDPYFTNEGYKRRIGYNSDGSTGYSLPWLQLDGSNGHHPNDMDGDMVYDFTDVYNSDWFDQYVAPPSGIDLHVSHSIEGQTVSLEISLSPLAEYELLETPPELILHVAVIEAVTTLNVGSNGQTEFHHVMKKMLPDHNGTPLPSLVRKDDLSFSMSYTFNGDYKTDSFMNNQVDDAIEHTVEEFEDLHVVVFVQDPATLEVHQSAWTLGDGTH